MSEKLDPIDELSAQLVMLEVICELIVANNLATMPVAAAEQAKRDIQAIMETPRDDSKADALDNRRIQRTFKRAAEKTERFLFKVSEREVLLRSARAGELH